MTTMIIQHDVADYDHWRTVFDGAETLRARHGCTANRVLRSHESDNRVTVLQEFNDLADAQRFASDPELTSAMAAAGVTGPPSIDFTSEAGPAQGIDNTSEWNFFDPASKPNLIRTITDHSERMLGLAEVPEAWHSPTACGHWEVRDIIGHLVDTTDGYLRAFDAARGGPAVAEPLGLAVMSSTADAGALQFRNKTQDELLDHLRSSRADMLCVFNDLTDAEWGELIVAHPYMGPLPSSFYAAGQLIDYAIHTWDIVEGSGRAHALDGDAAELLVPFCLIVWQYTATPRENPLEIGLRISGRNQSEHRIRVSTDGTTIEAGTVDDLDTVLDFDAASFVLTAMGRINGGSYRGDSTTAERFANGFFRI